MRLSLQTAAAPGQPPITPGQPPIVSGQTPASTRGPELNRGKCEEPVSLLHKSHKIDLVPKLTNLMSLNNLKTVQEMLR